MASPKKSISSATYFYIGDGAAPVVLHCFRAGKRNKEVPIQPSLVFAEVPRARDLHRPRRRASLGSR